MKIGIVGSKEYENFRKIKDMIYKLKQKFGDDLVIVSSGGQHGADRFAKKYALELGCKYKEHNPSHTVNNLYSAMNESFYNKPYKPRNFFHRNKFLAKDVDYLIAFIPDGVAAGGTTDTIKHAKKFGKAVVVVT